MTDLVPHDIRTAADQMESVVTGVDANVPTGVSGVTSALPGSQSAGAATTVSETWRTAYGSWVADLDRNLDEVTAAVDACAQEEGVGEVDHLDAPPEGGVGYRSSLTSSDGTREGETVIARAGDRIVMVAATHDAGADLSVDVREPLADVQDDAADLDLS